jgi:hypothetical protein
MRGKPKSDAAAAFAAVVGWVADATSDLANAGSAAVRRPWRLHAYMRGEAQRAQTLFGHYATPSAAIVSVDAAARTRELVARVFADIRSAARESRRRPSSIQWAIERLEQETGERCES